MKLRETALTLLFPSKCVLCRRVLRGSGPAVCDACQSSKPQDRARTGTYFSRCWTPMVYEGDVRNAILRYKFGGRADYAPALGGLLAGCVREHLDGQYDLISWTPVSARRLRERGYDQAELLAKAAASALGTEAVPTLEKHAHVAAQSGMDDPEARRRNVQGVYRVPSPERIRGARILLIDDVITTGATLDEAAKTLLEAGASEVLAAALAQP